MEILYFLIAIISTIIGSAAGIGGGVIIKPALDALSKYSLPTVNLLSSSTIFIMSIVTVFYQLKKKNKINSKNTIIVAIGSIIGGVIGQKIMTLLTYSRININIINNVQSVMLTIFLLIVFIYMKNKSNIKTYNINNITLIGLIGLFLGAISAFLGIGGGPMNVAAFTILFSMSANEAARNSIIVIFFSQGSKILSIALTTGFSNYKLEMLPIMLIGGILGGIIGYRLNKSVSEKNIVKVFNTVLIAIVILNVYNIFK
ncbi:sulfite exporter TauE/SafE family protein [Paraclostridium sordellii]|uniref:Probable membrane transporter protein n=1 Tax=Paraclostridium sordellii TaxID=1505 RepID=A0A0C7R8W5_PARSO|nr:sulfite exporter TauE/SafE family protein [Paeniclostridium sordellii]CEN80545.1 Sulfite exporter TauE/SafE [[Clostridium] sordellii] [Paeniclostridium sordellii]CEO15099.1 Sulfite exporter TauE/SafE [[Clostridium] sordellii] [Paeniclostridium sordellii]CEP90048.1 Sulfite exporter TauE/SafE [[Clostridium] sordellii] [Paeniclostridium sordellii]CEP98363.1 Sulfite exporter TauE/SafE [[Clostridium] sordellii] [Paeniclostridium sordellii]CEQ02122.1 Sulfite exporter TauE/SafE [[Clostridium] sord